MQLTETLTRQHQQLLDLAGRLSACLDRDRLLADGTAAAELIQSLTKALTAHLELEDGRLYPELLGADDAQIRETAQRYLDEMSGLGATYTAYASRWSSGAAISAQVDPFLVETGQIFAALGERIEREESGLFPLLSR